MIAERGGDLVAERRRCQHRRFGRDHAHQHRSLIPAGHRQHQLPCRWRWSPDRAASGRTASSPFRWARKPARAPCWKTAGGGTAPAAPQLTRCAHTRRRAAGPARHIHAKVPPLPKAAVRPRGRRSTASSHAAASSKAGEGRRPAIPAASMITSAAGKTRKGALDHRRFSRSPAPGGAQAETPAASAGARRGVVLAGACCLPSDRPRARSARCRRRCSRSASALLPTSFRRSTLVEHDREQVEA